VQHDLRRFDQRFGACVGTWHANACDASRQGILLRWRANEGRHQIAAGRISQYNASGRGPLEGSAKHDGSEDGYPILCDNRRKESIFAGIQDKLNRQRNHSYLILDVCRCVFPVRSACTAGRAPSHRRRRPLLPHLHLCHANHALVGRGRDDATVL
jgi:hypothetical protein